MNKSKDKRQPIKVFLRVRPINEIERIRGSPTIIDCVNNKEIVVNERPGDKLSKKFTFDKVFAPNSSQVDVYKSIASPLMKEVLDGYNCTIFAYGQTGTGKTYTMEGMRDNQSRSWSSDPHSGIIPRALSHLFDELRLLDAEFSVKASYLELYNEELIDLLSPVDDSSKIRLFEDATKKGGVIVNGLEEVSVKSKDEVYSILEKGSKKRQTASTLMNAVSSRSHTVFSITVRIKESGVEDGEEVLRTGKLNLVDLAGSENIGRSGAVDKRAREAGNINQSLLTLGRVITALVERTPHIPYRESKLTRLLQESLGGRTKTCIIATISPSFCNVEETLSTLEYAHRAKNIQNKPEINQKIGKAALIKEYIEEIDRLKADLMANRDKSGVYLAEDNYNTLMNQIQTQKREIAELLQSNKSLSEASEKKDELNCQLSESLQRYEEELQRTNCLLNETKVDRDKKNFLLDHHMETEKKLSQQAEILLSVADTATNDVSVLHNTLGRKQNLEESNLDLCQNFVVACKQKLDKLSVLSTNFKDSSSQNHQELLKKLESSSSTAKKFRESSLDMWNCAKTKQEELIERISVLNKQLITNTQTHVTNVEDKLKNFCNIDSEVLLPFMDEVLKKLNDINELNAVQHRQHQIFVEDLTSKIQEQETEVQNFLSLSSNTVRALKVEVEENEKILNTVNDVAQDMQDLQAGIESKMAESIDALKRDFLAQMNLIHFRTNDLKTHLHNVNLANINSQVVSFDASIADTQAKINDQIGNTSQLISECNNKTTCSVNAIQGVTSLCCDTVKNQKLSLPQRQKQRLKDTSECLLNLSQDLFSHESSVHTDMEVMNSNLSQFSESQKYTTQQQLDKKLHLIEAMKEDIVNECNLVKNCCSSIEENVCECGELLANFAEEVKKDTPSGLTPQRRDFSYPHSLVSTSPHERILTRFRVIEEDSVFESMDSSDNSTTPQLEQTENDVEHSSFEVPLQKFKSKSTSDILDKSVAPSFLNCSDCNIPSTIDKENSSPLKNVSFKRSQVLKKQVLGEHNG